MPFVLVMQAIGKEILTQFRVAVSLFFNGPAFDCMYLQINILIQEQEISLRSTAVSPRRGGSPIEWLFQSVLHHVGDMYTRLGTCG